MALPPFSDYRVLLMPGLYNSGPEHWQSRWQRLYPGFERVVQDDWDNPQLPAWSARFDELRARDSRPILVAAHSFGCLTAAYSLARDPRGVAGVLMVAPADPDKFGVAAALPQGPLPCPTIMISSTNDPWMSADNAALWGGRWGAEVVNIGAFGHINAESGLGDWLFGQSRLKQLLELAQSAGPQAQFA
ncbi:RBBP9/YdeN family alpha/beta hydrolase [Janthinobacterium fluminis]|uniref:Alpha/beta hydrolase n=1 Tax=Janthinobacterium fluminis TaxID=2987524 RepID=A0ABT5K3S0_9BURK|nr:alpha/beta hydrolase [Janthinobacterium fluminis]MDC8759396.1 alpha/beta hydrolase [Janthinobacterium fluminis]